MNQLTLEDLVRKMLEYNDEKSVEIVKKAYYYAQTYHDGQLRQSGEPYIIHPLNVATILAEIHADIDTVCAGLLHDTLEDTKATKEEITNEFNEEIAKLVDGVTKISKMNFTSKSEETSANTRKLINGFTDDVRIIIIKLADRLHNMRTLNYKTEIKQKETSIETLDIFVPFANLIGTYRVKNELEDLSLMYLKPEAYKNIAEKKQIIEEKNKDMLDDMQKTISEELIRKEIENEIKIRVKNIYGIYTQITKGNSLHNVHDLLSLKIIVDTIDNCYRTLQVVHSNYHPLQGKFRDYLFNPKANMYSSIHTTVFGPNGNLVQNQIRTFDMDKIASFGIAAYWDLEGDSARYKMQEDLKKYQFYKSLVEINNVFSDNKQFVTNLKQELFSNMIYVYTTKGNMIELPKGATPIDFAYKINPDIGNTMVRAIVNDEDVPVDYILNNNDRIKIETDILSYGPRDKWKDMAHTTEAKVKIMEFNKK